MNRISRSLTTIYRTERLIAQRRFTLVQFQTILFVASGLVAFAGLILLNMALYFFLVTKMYPAGAAAILALGNLALAALLALVAGRVSVEKEIAPAIEMRDMAIADLETELETASLEVREIIHTMKTAKTDPFGSLMALLVPIATAVVKKKTG